MTQENKSYVYLLHSDTAESNVKGVWRSVVRTIDGTQESVRYTSIHTVADFATWSKEGAEKDIRVVATLNSKDDILSTTFERSAYRKGVAPTSIRQQGPVLKI